MRKLRGSSDVLPRVDWMDQLIALAAFHSAIFARTSELMFQMKVKQQKEHSAAIMGKPMTISLMPAMVESA